jgi:hypothetical protein
MTVKEEIKTILDKELILDEEPMGSGCWRIHPASLESAIEKIHKLVDEEYLKGCALGYEYGNEERNPLYDTR